MTRFEIHQDISKAHCLDPSFYTDEAVFLESKDKIFAKTWQFAGLREDVDNVLPVTLLKSFLDEPLLLTDAGEKIRCISNVCTHRGNILVKEPCRIEGIRCGYHGRKFQLDGKFESMPGFEGVKDFPGADDDLQGVALAEWVGLLFVSLNPVANFDDFFDEILKQFGNFAANKEVVVASNVYDVDAHWALYCENYLEGFHIPFVHNSLNREIDFDSYKTELFEFGSLQTATGKQDDGDAAAACYYFVFPNLMFNFYPWGLSVNIVEPVTAWKTRVRYISMVTDPSKRGIGAGADLETVEMEDQEIVEAVQRGIGSRLYTPGRYSVKHEKGTHHFHRMISKFMNCGESK